MPRINPVPQREREIGARLRQFRVTNLKFSQVMLAKELEIDSTRLATYEHGRVPLRYSVAHRACERCGLNPQWLATGDGEREMPYPIPPPSPETLGVSGALPFSEVYDRHIAPNFVIPEDVLVAAPNQFTLEADARGRFNNIEWMCGMIRRMFIHVPNAGVLKMRRRIQDLVYELLKEPKDAWDEELRRVVQIEWLEKHSTKSVIDFYQQQADNPLVSLTWKELKRRLKSVTGERGKKSAAADFAGVDRSNMNRWLDDDQEPGAEAAFRLLEWVTAEEAKQKGPTAAVTSVELTAQTARQQANETKQSEPGKPSHRQRKKTIPRKR